MILNHILLVDDCQDLRDIFKGLLENALSSLGYMVSIESAESGEEALEKVRQQRYDLVLMDTQMGGMNGYAACMQMKERNKDQVVIGMSADEHYCEQWMCAGADAFIWKGKFSAVDKILVEFLKK